MLWSVSLQFYLDGTFPTHFFPVISWVIFLPVTVLPVTVLKDSTAEFLYQILGKASQFPYALQTGSSVKIENVRGKYQCHCPASIMLLCHFIKTELHHRYFSRNVPTFFGIFIWLHQTTIVLIGLRNGNCRIVIGETL